MVFHREDHEGHEGKKRSTLRHYIVSYIFSESAFYRFAEKNSFFLSLRPSVFAKQQATTGQDDGTCRQGKSAVNIAFLCDLRDFAR